MGSNPDPIGNRPRVQRRRGRDAAKTRMHATTRRIGRRSSVTSRRASHASGAYPDVQERRGAEYHAHDEEEDLRAGNERRRRRRRGGEGEVTSESSFRRALWTDGLPSTDNSFPRASSIRVMSVRWCMHRRAWGGRGVNPRPTWKSLFTVARSWAPFAFFFTVSVLFGASCAVARRCFAPPIAAGQSCRAAEEVPSEM